ncbi:Protein of unknown function [Gryllus bimaculatus]|nr:Protein of unknown function [Gryllus bimaculatus]
MRKVASPGGVSHLVVDGVGRVVVGRPLHHAGLALVALERQRALVGAERGKLVGRRLRLVGRPVAQAARAGRVRLSAPVHAHAGEHAHLLRTHTRARTLGLAPPQRARSLAACDDPLYTSVFISDLKSEQLLEEMVVMKPVASMDVKKCKKILHHEASSHMRHHRSKVHRNDLGFQCRTLIIVYCAT